MKWVGVDDLITWEEEFVNGVPTKVIIGPSWGSRETPSKPRKDPAQCRCCRWWRTTSSFCQLIRPIRISAAWEEFCLFQRPHQFPLNLHYRSLMSFNTLHMINRPGGKKTAQYHSFHHPRFNAWVLKLNKTIVEEPWEAFLSPFSWCSLFPLSPPLSLWPDRPEEPVSASLLSGPQCSIPFMGDIGKSILSFVWFC